MIKKLELICRKVSNASGMLACLLMVLMLFNVFVDVVMRYAFNDVSIGMQELEWHLFASVFLLGVPYAMQQGGHVRVDIFYEQWSEQRKAWVNLIGALFFVMPFVVLVTYYGIGFSVDSFQMNEGSGDPGGLPYRWVIKSLMPVSFILIGIAGLGMIAKAVLVLKGESSYENKEQGGIA